MPIMPLKQCPKAGAVMAPTAPGGVMRLTAELSRRRGSAGKYKPCFVKASVTATWETAERSLQGHPASLLPSTLGDRSHVGHEPL